MTDRLPAGWTLDRVRDVSGDRTAVLREPTMAVSIVLRGPSGVSEAPLRPELVIACGDLCVVKCADDDDWLMGSFGDDGSVLCWAAYPGLEEALRGL